VAAEFVSRFPTQRFVLDHLAKPFIRKRELQPWEDHLKRLASFSNVFCKLSGLVTEADWQSWKPEGLHPYLKVAWECFGPERLMIGSDWPVCTVAASYSQTMQVVTDFLKDSTEAARDAVLGGTAARLWQLKP
jgi:L-fuconolactonase